MQIGDIFFVGVYRDRAKFQLGHHNSPDCRKLGTAIANLREKPDISAQYKCFRRKVMKDLPNPKDPVELMGQAYERLLESAIEDAKKVEKNRDLNCII